MQPPKNFLGAALGKPLTVPWDDGSLHTDLGKQSDPTGFSLQTDFPDCLLVFWQSIPDSPLDSSTAAPQITYISTTTDGGASITSYQKLLVFQVPFINITPASSATLLFHLVTPVIQLLYLFHF